MTPVVVLGIDPGSRRTGFGVIQVAGGRVSVVAFGTLLAGPGDFCSRLALLGKGLEELLDRHKPNLVGVEQAFHARNARATLVLGQVRGVFLWLAATRGLPVREFAPRAVKLSVTGRGAAAKVQVAGMVQRILSLAKRPPADAADALAVALCCAHRLALETSLRQGTTDARTAPTGGHVRTARTATTDRGEVVDLSRAFRRVRRGEEDRALETLLRTHGPGARVSRGRR